MGGSGNSSPAGKGKVVEFRQTGRNIRVTRMGENIKAEFNTPTNRTWKLVTNEKQLQTIKEKINRMDKYNGVSTKVLESELSKLKTKQTITYDTFTKTAHSKGRTLSAEMVDIDIKVSDIEAVLKNRRRNNVR